MDEDRDRLPGWLWFFLALPVGLFMMVFLRRRQREQSFQQWQMEEGFREREVGGGVREAFMGEATPADAAYSLPTAPAIETDLLATPNTGDEAYVPPGHGSRFSGSPTVNRRGRAGEENTADIHPGRIGARSFTSSRPADVSPVSDEDIEAEDTRMEEMGQVAVTGGDFAPTADAPTMEAGDEAIERDLSNPYDADAQPPVRVQPSTGEIDDLKVIEGIGPSISGLLQSQGITTFRQLADTPIERLDEILRQADLRRLADPGTWPEQARMAAEGRMDDLIAFQRTLKAGRRMS